MQVFVKINNAGTKLNVRVNLKNRLIKLYMTKDLSGVLVIMNVNVINPVIFRIFRFFKL